MTQQTMHPRGLAERLRLTCQAFIVGFILLAAGPVPAMGAERTLREAAAQRMVVGVGVSAADTADPAVANLVAGQFVSVTAVNEFKPDQLQPKPGEFRFRDADRVADFARERGVAVVGHTLCWHEQSPRWMFASADGTPLPREQALANLRTHITAVVGHFRGRVRGWDVVNEPVGNDDAVGAPDLRDTPARRAIGDDYLELAFRFAREADPEAELYLNDFNIETPRKRERAIRAVRRLRAAGVRLDAVGIQGHWGLEFPRADVIEEAIRAFAAEGVKVMITELDVDVLPYRAASLPQPTGEEATKADPYRDGCPPHVLQAQARRYGELMRLFVKHRATVTRVTFWGVQDGSSWLNDFPVRGRTNYPLLWDRRLEAKPAFGTVLDALADVTTTIPGSTRRSCR